MPPTRLASLGQNAVIPPILVPFLIAVLGLLVVAHLANRVLGQGRRRHDPSAGGAAARHRLRDHRQAQRARPPACRRRGPSSRSSPTSPRWWSSNAPADLARYQWSFLAIGAALLLLPLVPGVGNTKGGARIWVSIGPINFQPGEFAKIALALFFAGYLADHRELIAAGAWRVGPFHLPELRHLLPIALAWGFAVVVMVAEKDLGSSLLFFTLFVVMMWVVDRASELPGDRSAAIFRRGLRRLAAVRSRPDPRGDLAQPVAAVRGQGLPDRAGDVRVRQRRHWRHGLGLGSPNKIPVAKNDFIFAAIGEELGLLGTTAVLIGFLLMIGGGLRIATRADRAFEKLLATGLTTIVGMQAFIIIGGVIRVVPLTGIALAVRQLRRLEPVGQLRAARAAGPRQRFDCPPARRDTRTS